MAEDGASNGTIEPADNSTNDEETFHIYILSFAYGILAVVVIGHLVWRWQWRRRKLAQFQPHVPGDKSFKCQAMRQQLRNDFAAVKAVSADPRLVNPSHQSEEVGASVPVHWYRMKMFDVAADLVAGNVSLVQDGDRCSLKELPLPKFLDQLRRSSSGLGEQRLKGQEDVVERCCELYTQARYKDGKFGEEQFQEFKSLVQKIQQSLQLIPKGAAVECPPFSSPIHISHPPRQRDPVYHHKPLGGTSSQEPLLEGCGSLDVGTPLQETATLPTTLTKRDSKSKRKADEIELSPLVSDTDSMLSPSSLSHGSQEAARGQAFEIVERPLKSTVPETLV